MLPLIIGVFGAIVIESIAKSSAERHERAVKNFDEHFTQIPGDRRILVEDRRAPGVHTIRRYRPTFMPAPWELHAAIDDDGMEQFAVSCHGAFTEFRVTIRPVKKSKKRPIDVHSVFNEEEPSKAAPDPCYENRYRYFHPEEGTVGWFVVRIASACGKTWLFEHQSLHSELVRPRPALPAPSATTSKAPDSGADYAAYLAVLLARSKSRTEAQMAEAQRRTDLVAGELAKLKAEIPGMVNAARQHAISPEGVADRLSMIKRIAAVTQQALFEIESSIDIDEEMKEQMKTIVMLEGDRNLEQLRRAVEAELDAVKRSKA